MKRIPSHLFSWCKSKTKKERRVEHKVGPRPRATSRLWHLHRDVDPALGLEFHLFVGRHLTCHSRCTCLMELWQRKLHVADVADLGRCLQLQKPSAVKPGQVCCRVTTTSASLSTSSIFLFHHRVPLVDIVRNLPHIICLRCLRQNREAPLFYARTLELHCNDRILSQARSNAKTLSSVIAASNRFHQRPPFRLLRSQKFCLHQHGNTMQHVSGRWDRSQTVTVCH